MKEPRSQYISIAHNGSSFAVPSALLGYMQTADEIELKVILAILSSRTCESSSEVMPSEICAIVFGADNCGADNIAQIERAIAFWRGTGFIKVARHTSPAKTASDASSGDAVSFDALPSLQPLRSPPSAAVLQTEVMLADKSASDIKPAKSAKPLETYYPMAELAERMETCTSFKFLINMAQQKLGKIFNQSDMSILYNIFEAMNLPADYILMLIDYYSKKKKITLRYIEKTAIALSEEGIDTSEKLERHIIKLQKSDEFEGKIRKLFGIGEQSLSTKQKGYYARWAEYTFPYDMIVLAYEKTVDAIQTPSPAYMDKILSNWHEKGYTSLEEALAENKPPQATPGLDAMKPDVRMLIERASSQDY